MQDLTKHYISTLEVMEYGLNCAFTVFGYNLGHANSMDILVSIIFYHFP